MKNYTLNFIVVCFCFIFANQVMAEDVKTTSRTLGVEMSVFSNGQNISGEPVPVSSNGQNNDFKIVLPIGNHFNSNLSLAGEIDFNKKDISIGGVSLGSINSKYFSITLRDYPLVDKTEVAPYFGAGLFKRNLSRAVLAGGALKSNSSASSGFLLEGGVNILLPAFFGKHPYVDLNLNKKFGTNTKSEIRTIYGNALVTRLGDSNDPELKISIGIQL